MLPAREVVETEAAFETGRAEGEELPAGESSV